MLINKVILPDSDHHTDKVKHMLPGAYVTLSVFV